ncbi:N-acetylmuramoyl-L-alanine amidase [Streptomyces sp. SID12488]|uniref:N-acetylmuramoyl-L-alanine amidase n=1 Tax=Streptomyces sp. SID12488 TaxID=2706040 RepID=UPI001EF1E9D5|nr:N-acetylmuramoyl-L-alanine amidase [Streptomyces sp. SID12488]
MRLVTRAQLGWPASAAPLQATTKGVKVHYEGTAVSTRLLTDHAACIAEWKAIRASHLANTTENYSDIAYNYGACPHGYLLEGRGLGRRTGANGNQTLNKAHYAIVGLVGDEGLTEPTGPMLGAIRDGIELLREDGAGDEIEGHRDGYATACPGGPLYAWVQKGAPRPIKEDDVALTADDINKVAIATVNHLLGGGGALENSDVDRIVKAIGARPATLTDAQVQALATNPALAESIAEKVAVKLAARLAN